MHAKGAWVMIGLALSDEATALAWTGSWTGGPDNSRTMWALRAIGRAICAASAVAARQRTYGKEKVCPSAALR